MNIAILGFGTVGTGVAKIVEGADAMSKTAKLQVSHIFVRPENENLDRKLVADYDKILNDTNVDAVVEVLGGIEPAHSMIIDALKHHKHVVTANKAVVAQYMEEFIQVASDNGVEFRFEASVGGGIPWITNLERTMRIDQVNALSGIFNGTSNFILDQMTKTGASFDSVLKQAQDLGYAEADPSADIDGYDIENKLCITVDIAYGTLVQPGKHLPKFGIRTIQAADIDYFKKQGLVIKLMGRSIHNGDSYSYVIEPTAYQPSQIEASINDNFNYASFHGETIGDLGFIGQGAGMYPTAHAVIQDLLDIKLCKDHLQHQFNQPLQLDNHADKGTYVIRTTDAEFTSKASAWQPSKDNNGYFKIDNIDVHSMHALMQEVLAADAQAFMVRIAEGV